jgi:hypothetical protein
VDLELFEAVQVQLAANRVSRHHERPVRAAAAPLTGLLFDAEGLCMTPSFAYGRKGRLYRYYVSAALQRGGRACADDQIIRRVPAAALESFVAQRLQNVLPTPPQDWSATKALLHRVEVQRSAIHIILASKRLVEPYQDVAALIEQLKRRLPQADQIILEESALRLICAQRASFRGGRTWRNGGAAAPTNTKPASDPALAKSLRSAHRWLLQLSASPFTAPEDFMQAQAAQDSFIRRLLPLAFLAPELQRAIVTGRAPRGLTLSRLLSRELPLAWADQPDFLRALGSN